MTSHYWCPHKARYEQHDIENFTAIYHPLSGAVHLLSQQHMVILNVLPDSRGNAIDMNSVIKRVQAAHSGDLDEAAEDALVTAMQHLVDAELVETGAKAAC